jgi:hypothetical protein
MAKPWRNFDRFAGVWNYIMKTDNGLFGLVVGGIVALAAIIFILSGGELGGKKTISGDDDLPPVETTTH